MCLMSVHVSARMFVSVYPWMCLWVWMCMCEDGFVCIDVCLSVGHVLRVCACVSVCVLWLRSQKAYVTLMDGEWRTNKRRRLLMAL